jgi:hypothetical protein
MTKNNARQMKAEDNFSAVKKLISEGNACVVKSDKTYNEHLNK